MAAPDSVFPTKNDQPPTTDGRAEWERPALRRIAAAEAKGGDAGAGEGNMSPS